MNSRTKERTLYWTVIAVLFVLLAGMLITWNVRGTSTAAQVKAQELVQAFEDAGLTAPESTQQIASVLGENGGAICAAAADPDKLGSLRTQIGVGGEFYFRPAITHEDVIQGINLVVATYCPAHLPQVQQFERNVTVLGGI